MVNSLLAAVFIASNIYAAPDASKRWETVAGKSKQQIQTMLDAVEKDFQKISKRAAVVLPAAKEVHDAVDVSFKAWQETNQRLSRSPCDQGDCERIYAAIRKASSIFRKIESFPEYLEIQALEGIEVGSLPWQVVENLNSKSSAAEMIAYLGEVRAKQLQTIKELEHINPAGLSGLARTIKSMAVQIDGVEVE